jgi:hypothetical protein
LQNCKEAKQNLADTCTRTGQQISDDPGNNWFRREKHRCVVWQPLLSPLPAKAEPAQ